MLKQGQFTRTNGGAPDSNYPIFRMDTIEDPVATAAQGRPIFREEERVEIVSPGNPHNRPVFKVTEDHKQRWPEHYERFKNQHEFSVEGTPLEEWSVLKRNQVLELKALGLLTVEHIRDMSDLACQRIGIAGMSLRQRAGAFLDDAMRNALVEKQAAEVAKRDAENAELTRKVNELSALLNQVHGELQAMKNAPSVIASAIPSLADPIEQMKLPPPAPAGSSLDAFASPARRRGKAAEAAA